MYQRSRDHSPGVHDESTDPSDATETARPGPQEASESDEPTAVAAVGVSKSFGPVSAVVDADFDAGYGEVHALVGENGAGKSTLIKMLCGVLRPDSGRIEVDGRPRRLSSPHDARAVGIDTVFQELTLLPWMTVAENLLINDPPGGRFGLVRRRAMPAAAGAILAQYGMEGIDPRQLAANLSVAERQIVEIIRAVQRDPRILFLDEPTASLSEHEVEWLFALVQRLRAQGRCIIFTSHRWREVEHLADRITVFRNGTNVATQRTLSEDEAVTLMTGRTLDRAYPSPPPLDEDHQPALEVTALSTERLREVSFHVRPGEILGVGGLAGQGQRELFLALFGAVRASAEIRVGGSTRHIRGPADAIAAGIGIALVPEDRKSEGLLLPMSVRDNLTLAVLPRVSTAGVIRPDKEQPLVTRVVRQLDVRTSSMNTQAVGALSGGNQQKALIGRWLLTDADVLLLYDVTRGVDVATKHDIYDLIVDLAARGKAILFYSSETEEIARLSHRVLVLREGRVCAELGGANLDAESIVVASVREVPGGEAPAREASQREAPVQEGAP